MIMAPFFMRKRNYIISGAIIGFIVSNIFVESKYLTAICLLSILIYAEMMVRDVKKLTEEKEKTMGLRLIEGMKALTDLCRNAFDHLKTHKQSIDKINAKLGDHTGKLHQLDQRQHRVAGSGNKEPRVQERPQEAQRVERPQRTPKENFGRTGRKTKGASENVPNTEP